MARLILLVRSAQQTRSGPVTVGNRFSTSRVLLVLALATALPLLNLTAHASAGQPGSSCEATVVATPASSGEFNQDSTDSVPYDLHFIDEMIAHHAGAIAMASLALQQAQDSDVLRMALRIAESQAGEIQLLRHWRESWYPGAEPTYLPSQADAGGTSLEPDDTSAIVKLCAAGGDFDRLFFEIMVSHHGASIAIADDATAHAEHAEIIAYAESLIEAQRKEVAMMSRWLDATVAIPDRVGLNPESRYPSPIHRRGDKREE